MHGGQPPRTNGRGIARRSVLTLGGGLALGAMAGCLGDDDGRSGPPLNPPLPEDRPDGPYLPTHDHGMRSIDTVELGDRMAAVSYTFPHRFWTVTGTETGRVSVTSEDSIHLMVTTWDPETGTALPAAEEIRAVISRDGDPVDERVLWRMISQSMGVHAGDNIALPGTDEYRIELHAGGVEIDTVGSLAGRLGAGATATVDFQYSIAERNQIPWDPMAERAGEPGAIEMMAVGEHPMSIAPDPESFTGTRLEPQEFDGWTLEWAHAAGEDETSLVISTRTEYNDSILPMMTLEVRIDRDGNRMATSPARPTIGPTAGYHYRATIPSLEAGDILSVAVEAPAQIARHEGYETAFFDRTVATVIIE